VKLRAIRTQHLLRNMVLMFALRGWRPITASIPPPGLEVLGLCSWTGVRSVATRVVSPTGYVSWDRWHHSFPTHYQLLPDALPLTPAPPARPPIYER
jgi:hypothetical protein